jgi:hypothetical protein
MATNSTEQRTSMRRQERRAAAVVKQEPRAAEEGRPTLLDCYLPNFDLSEDRHVIVNTTPEATYKAVRELDFGQIRSPLVRSVFAFHAAVVRREARGSEPSRRPVPRRFTFDNLEEFGRIKLAEEPGTEIVVGAIEQGWTPIRITAEEFYAFDRPGFVKAAASFSVQPWGEKRSLLSYEARARATDEVTRRRLFRAAGLMAPLSRAMLARVLDHIKAVAEHRC